MGAALGMFSLGLSAPAEDFPNFWEIPYLSVQNPYEFAALLNEGHTRTIRIGMLGDSQESVPSGGGRYYLPRLNYEFYNFYGNSPSTPYLPMSGGEPTYLVWNGDYRSSRPDMRDTVREEHLPSGGSATYFFSANLPGPSARGLGFSLYPRNEHLSRPYTLGTQLENAHQYFNTNGVIRAEIVARTYPGSGEISYRVRPHGSSTSNMGVGGIPYYASVTASGTISLGLDEPAPYTFKKGRTAPLGFAGKKFLMVEFNSDDGAKTTDVAAMSYVNETHPEGVVVTAFGYGGHRMSDFLGDSNEPNSTQAGPVFKAYGFEIGSLHFGANEYFTSSPMDAAEGVSGVNGFRPEEMKDLTMRIIQWMRDAMGDPNFKVILFTDPSRRDFVAGSIIDDRANRHAGVNHNIALQDPNVLAINSRRLTEDVGWTRGNPLINSYVADMVHLTSAGSILLADLEINTLLDITDGASTNPPTYYALTVNNGSGSGDYAAGTTIMITADAAPAGQVFDVWTGATGGLENVYATSTLLTMPAAVSAVTATYKIKPPDPTNVALGQPAFASSNPSTAGNVVDGSGSTYWGSVISQINWVYVDLGATHDISRIVVDWSPYNPSKEYHFQTSADAVTWTTVYTDPDGAATYEVNDVTLVPVAQGRYVRMLSTKSAAPTWGIRFDQLEVWGVPSSGSPTTYALTVNNGSGDGSYTAGTVVSITADAAPSGQVFDQWTGDTAGIASIQAGVTTLTMPAAVATVTATYKTTSSGGEPVMLPFSQLGITSSGYYPGGEDDQAFSGEGLTGDLHNNMWQEGWLSDGGTPAGEWIKIDLGGTYLLDHLRVWNCNQQSLTTRGIAQADIYVALIDPGHNVDGGANGAATTGNSFDPTGWTLAVANQPFVKSPGTADIANTDPHIALGGVQAAFLAVRVDTSHGDAYVGLSEMQIFAAEVTDHDGDGLPTDWENGHGLDPNDDGSIDPDQGADGDLDLDGATNREEWIADTHPGDSNSLFVITGTVSNPDGSLDVTLNSSSARIYLLQGASDLSAPRPWPVLDGPTAGTGGAMTLNDATVTSTADRAYTVEVQMP